MDFINIKNIRKCILFMGMLFLYFAHLPSVAQGVGEQINLNKDAGFDPLTDDITKKIPSLEVLIDSAIINSHRMRYWDKEITITEYETKSIKRDWANYFAIGGDYKDGRTTSLVFVEDQMGNEVGTLGTTNQARYSLGITFRIPLIAPLDYNNQIKIGKMKIESKIEQKLTEQQALRTEVINLYNELVINQKMLKLDIDNIEYLELTSEMAGTEYSNNKLSLFDLSRARDNLARARYRYVRTKIMFVNAYVMLQEVTGVTFAELNNWE